MQTKICGKLNFFDLFRFFNDSINKDFDFYVRVRALRAEDLSKIV